MSCACCGSVETEPTSYRDVMGFKGADLHRCLGCGVKYYPVPLVQFVPFHNSDAARMAAEANVRCGATNNRDESKVDETLRQRRSYFACMLNDLRPHVGSVKRIYEVGTDFGQILEVARDDLGMAVAGCEVNGHAAAIARSRGLDVEGVHFQAATVPMGLDAVVMNDVIEHTNTPRADLEKACRHLRPGGGLLLKTFYDEFHSTIKKLNIGPDAWYDPNHGYFDPLGHLHHFDLPVLLKLIESCGFTISEKRIDEHWGQVTVFAKGRSS